MNSSESGSSKVDWSNELWLMILDLLYEDDWHNLLAVSQTSSRLDELVKPLIFRNIVIDRNKWTEKRYKSLLGGRDSLARHTTNIEVLKGSVGHDYVPVSEKYIPEIVGVCLNLQDFTWDGDYALLPPIQQHIIDKKVWLHYSIWGSFNLLAHLDKLPHNNVRSLDLHVTEFFVDSTTQRYFEEIARAMEKCVNLNKLILAMVPDDESSVDTYLFDEQYRLPPIRDITLHSYDWPEEYEANHKYWNFSKIERLVLINVSIRTFLRNSSFAMSNLSHLTELVLGDLDGGHLESMQADNTNFMLMQVVASQVWRRAINLRSLAIPRGWRSFLPTQNFSLLNSNLRELNLLLRKRNCNGSIWTEPMNDALDLEDLTALHEACPRLQKLHFATRLSGRSAALHHDLVNNLARFQHLRELRLEDDEFLGHDLAYGCWINIPSRPEGAHIAKRLMVALLEATKSLQLERIVIVTSGRYSRNEDYDHMYFRKYETDGWKFGHAESQGYEDEPTLALDEDLRSSTLS